MISVKWRSSSSTPAKTETWPLLSRSSTRPCGAISTSAPRPAQRPGGTRSPRSVRQLTALFWPASDAGLLPGRRPPNRPRLRGTKVVGCDLADRRRQTREENPCDRRPGEDLLFECPPGAGRLIRLSRPPQQSGAAPRSTGRPATGGLGGWTSRRLATFPLAPPPRMSIPPGRQAGPQ